MAKGSKNIVIAGVLGALLLGLLYFWLFVADDMGDDEGNKSGESAEVSAVASPQQMFAVLEVNIRDQPTTNGSSIIGKLPRGSAVTGTLKTGEDDRSEWLELSEGKGFIAAVNLSQTEPPVIVKSLGDKIWTADDAIEIWEQPDTSSTLVDRVSEGTNLTLSGLTSNGFIEIKLKGGGVGYISDGAAIVARANGRPIAVSFNPETCTFGGELDSEFDKLATRIRAQWEALEDRKFADEAARERALNAAEGKSTYMRLPRSFAGLSLTAIAQHYESQSLYFADPPAKVIAVLRAQGFRLNSDGAFPSTELYAGINATRGEGAVYGKSELGCGV